MCVGSDGVLTVVDMGCGDIFIINTNFNLRTASKTFPSSWIQAVLVSVYKKNKRKHYG
jgi:hypothetical protein